MCRMVPSTARALCSPSRHIMAVPTRIKPIWEMEEQARVRFRSMEHTASTAPSTMVTAPMAASSSPQAPSYRKMVVDSTRMPYTPVLMMMPDSTAEAGAGAAGWAVGSQMCRGKAPALAPKPTSTSREPAHSSVRSSTAAAAAPIRSRSRVPSCP